MKYFALAVLLMLVGCGKPPIEITQEWERIIQSRMDIAAEVCKDGVVYYAMMYSQSIVVTPAFNQNSTVKTCKG